MGATRILSRPDGECELHLDDDTVSARHAELRPAERGWLVRDLGSTNGVMVDGLRGSSTATSGSTRWLRRSAAWWVKRR